MRPFSFINEMSFFSSLKSKSMSPGSRGLQDAGQRPNLPVDPRQSIAGARGASDQVKNVTGRARDESQALDRALGVSGKVHDQLVEHAARERARPRCMRSLL